MASKLILVEGLPGAGKSTTAQQVRTALDAKGIDTELYSEGNLDHPADFDGVAYFDSEDFSKLDEMHLLNKIKVEYLNGYLIPYRKAIEEQQFVFDEALLNVILKNDIYELPMELHMELILNKWNDFAKRYVTNDKVVIFECCFIQNPITVSMIKNNCDKNVTIDFINNLTNIVMPLAPLLIYVEHDSIKKSFMKAVSERPKEWKDGFIDYYTNQGYGLNNHLKGIEGVLEVLEARNKLEKEIYDSLDLIKYKIDNSAFSPEMLNEKINIIIEKNF